MHPCCSGSELSGLTDQVMYSQLPPVGGEGSRFWRAHVVPITVLEQRLLRYFRWFGDDLTVNDTCLILVNYLEKCFLQKASKAVWTAPHLRGTNLSPAALGMGEGGRQRQTDRERREPVGRVPCQVLRFCLLSAQVMVRCASISFWAGISFSF